MKIGIIGIGDICKKAYLPVITSMNKDIVLCSRKKKIVEETANKYRISDYCYDYHDLVDYCVEAVFIHTATSSHYEIAKFFLEKDIHVYVDKPISDRLEETMELYELALEKKLVLMVGFNRRYSPRVRELMTLDRPELVIIQKNRHKHPGDVRTFIYDDFIHVVDTLLFLFRGQEEEFDYNFYMEGDKLNHVILILQGQGATGIGSMNRRSGAKEERIEYMTSDRKNIIEDLDAGLLFENNHKSVIQYDDWTGILKRRGFEDILKRFFSYVEEPALSFDELEMSLRSHEVCEYLVMEISK